jgi:hypothetical protein
MNWKARFVRGQYIEDKAEAETIEELVEWAKDIDKRIFDDPFTIDKPRLKQWGMDYYWLAIWRNDD